MKTFVAFAALVAAVAAKGKPHHSSSSSSSAHHHKKDFSILPGAVLDAVVYNSDDAYELGYTSTVFECQQLCATDPKCVAYQWFDEFATGADYAVPFLCIGSTKIPDRASGINLNGVAGHRLRRPEPCREDFITYDQVSLVKHAQDNASHKLIVFGNQLTETQCQLMCLDDDDCYQYTWVNYTTPMCYGLKDKILTLTTNVTAARSGRRAELCLENSLTSSSSSSHSTKKATKKSGKPKTTKKSSKKSSKHHSKSSKTSKHHSTSSRSHTSKSGL